MVVSLLDDVSLNEFDPLSLVTVSLLSVALGRLFDSHSLYQNPQTWCSNRKEGKLEIWYWIQLGNGNTFVINIQSFHISFSHFQHFCIGCTDNCVQTCAVARQNSIKTNKLPYELLDKTSRKFVFCNSIKVLWYSLKLLLP